MAQVEYKFKVAKDTSDETILYDIREKKYSTFLNNVGEASFVISQDDAKLSDIEQGDTLHIERANKTVWSGVIEDIVPFRRSSLKHVKVIAYDDMFRLQEYLLIPDTGSEVYKRTFTDQKLGTEIVTDVFNEAAAKEDSLLADISLGTIEDPIDEEDKEIEVSLELYAANLWDIIAGCADYGDADFYIEDDELNFVKDKGTTRDKKFIYRRGQVGNNLVNYADTSELSEVKNVVIGIGAGDGENLTIVTEMDTPSISKYGRREGIAVVKELNNEAVLSLATKDFLRAHKNPDHLLAVQLSQNEIPFEGYDIGDRVYIEIVNGIHNISQKYRIVGVEVQIDENNVEETLLQLNIPSEKHQ